MSFVGIFSINTYDFILLSVFYNCYYICIYIVSHIYMTCVYDLFDYYTWSGMTYFKKTWLESRCAWSECFPDNLSMKWNRKEYLLIIYCLTGAVLTDISFLRIGALPGVFLWKGDGGRKGRGSNDCTCCVPTSSVWSSSTPVKRWRSCSCFWYNFSL